MFAKILVIVATRPRVDGAFHRLGSFHGTTTVSSSARRFNPELSAIFTVAGGRARQSAAGEH
jgi:hypothetical protein